MADVTARERADAVLAKYEDRAKHDIAEEHAGSAGLPQWWGELRQDIENAINVVYAEAVGKVPFTKTAAPTKAEIKDVEDRLANASRKSATTHMPATGSHASTSTRAHK